MVSQGGRHACTGGTSAADKAPVIHKPYDGVQYHRGGGLRAGGSPPGAAEDEGTVSFLTSERVHFCLEVTNDTLDDF